MFRRTVLVLQLASLVAVVLSTKGKKDDLGRRDLEKQSEHMVKAENGDSSIQFDYTDDILGEVAKAKAEAKAEANRTKESMWSRIQKFTGRKKKAEGKGRMGLKQKLCKWWNKLRNVTGKGTDERDKQCEEVDQAEPDDKQHKGVIRPSERKSPPEDDNRPTTMFYARY